MGDFEVFLSYKQEDRHIALVLKNILKSHGFSVWWDEHLIPNTREGLGESIVQRLDDARAVIAIWTRLSVHSHWVKAEARRALRRRKLLQVVYGAEPDDLPLPFAEFKFADLTHWDSIPTEHREDLLVGLIGGLLMYCSKSGIRASPEGTVPEDAVMLNRDVIANTTVGPGAAPTAGPALRRFDPDEQQRDWDAQQRSAPDPQLAPPQDERNFVVKTAGQRGGQVMLPWDQFIRSPKLLDDAIADARSDNDDVGARELEELRSRPSNHVVQTETLGPPAGAAAAASGYGGANAGASSGQGSADAAAPEGGDDHPGFYPADGSRGIISPMRDQDSDTSVVLGGKNTRGTRRDNG